MIKHAIILLFTLLAASLNAQTIELAADINPYGNSIPHDLVVFHNQLYFLASDSSLGERHYQIWSTDGSVPGAQMVTNILDTSLSILGRLKVVNDKLCFTSYSLNGKKSSLRSSNGLPGSTQLVTNMYPAYDPYTSEDFVFNNNLYFVASDTLSGQPELWITDGTPSGTSVLKILDSNGAEHRKFDPTLFKNKLYFILNDSAHKCHLWVTDGTTFGTHIVNLPVEVNAQLPYYGVLTEFQNELYFSGFSKDTILQKYSTGLYATDGTWNGTRKVSNVSLDHPSEFCIFKNKLYFSGSDGTHGIEPWVTDGTDVGTKMLKDIQADSVTNFTVFNDDLFFVTHNGRDHLWKSDGTETGTSILMDTIGIGNFDRLKVFKNKLYFFTQRYGIPYYVQLWVNDGTIDGNRVLKMQSESWIGTEFFEFKNALYFSADFDNVGMELYRITDNQTSVDVTQKENAISISPAIAHSQLHVTVSEPASIVIYDLLGNSRIKLTLQTSGTIDISNLNNGMYFLRSENSPLNTKFIKQ